jgi:hypothetical protein
MLCVIRKLRILAMRGVVRQLRILISGRLNDIQEERQHFTDARCRRLAVKISFWVNDVGLRGCCHIKHINTKRSMLIYLSTFLLFDSRVIARATGFELFRSISPDPEPNALCYSVKICTKTNETSHWQH